MRDCYVDGGKKKSKTLKHTHTKKKSTCARRDGRSVSETLPATCNATKQVCAPGIRRGERERKNEEKNAHGVLRRRWWWLRPPLDIYIYIFHMYLVCSTRAGWTRRVGLAVYAVLHLVPFLTLDGRGAPFTSSTVRCARDQMNRWFLLLGCLHLFLALFFLFHLV